MEKWREAEKQREVERRREAEKWRGEEAEEKSVILISLPLKTKGIMTEIPTSLRQRRVRLA